MAFRQIKSPALANQAVLNTKLDVSSVAGHTAAAGVGSLANDTLLMHSASENALRKLSVANLVNSLSTDNLAEGSNLYFTDARAQAAVAADIASAVLVEKTRAEGAESVIASDLADEIARATAAEGVNATAIAAEKSRAETAEAAITTAYEAADSALQTQINNIISNVDPAALDSLAEIVAEFQAQDTAINAAVTANANSISAETTARQGADLILQGNIDDVQAELDATQTGAGLGADGSYAANASANYISEAVSLVDADNKLDAALKALDTAYKAADTTHSNDIAALEGRMDTAESDIDTLESDLAAEVLRATAAEEANASSIQDEISARATAVQGAKDYADTQDAAQYVTVTSDIADALASAEAYADQAELDAVATSNAYTDARETAITTAYQAYADTAEADAVTSANSYTDGKITEVNAANAAAIADLESTDESLQSQIDNILSNTDADALDSLSEIVAAFTAADSSLSGLIGANQTAISTEATTRASADTTLQSNIDSEATTRAAADVTLQDNIDSEEADRIAADSALQGELDATQAGAGLNTDGSYSANTSANYISAATSMVDADNKLDAALKAEETARVNAVSGLQSQITANDGDIATNAADIATNATAIATEKSRAEGAEADLQANIDDVQAELDTTQAGAGLAADGTYVANASANYISTATSLKDADTKLDAQAKTNADAIATETQARIDAVSAEATARSSADSALQTAINNEKTRAETAESNLSDRITSNDGDITTLQNNLTTEISARSSGDTALQGKIDTVESSAGLSIDGAYVADETKTYIDDATTLFNADQQLDDAIVAEVARATAAEGAIAGDLADEVARATAAEGAIAGDLADEVARATAAEGAIAGDLADEVARATAAEGVNATAIATEKTRAEGEEARIEAKVDSAQTDLDTLEGRFDALVDGADGALDTLKEIGDAFAAADSDLQTLITSNSTRLTTNEGDIDALELAVGDVSTLTTDATDIAGAINELNNGSAAAVKDVQDELDATQVGAGLGTDGSYTANATANYISEATSLVDADNKLDAQVKANADAIAAEESARIADVDAEETRAIAAEGVLQGNIDAEETRAIAAEGVLQDNIDAEELRATGEESRIEGKVDTNAANLAQEILDRVADVDAEETRALAAEGVLQGNIDAEATTRAANDLTLQGNIDTEEAARIAADGVLQGNIDAEATARGNADAQIRTDFAAADTAIQQELDATQTGAGLGTDGAYTANGSANYISAATSLKDADNKLDAAVKAMDTAYKAADVTLQTNIDAEVTRATGAEGVLQSNIDAEATTRATADTALQTRATNLETEMTATQSGAGLGTDGTYTANADANYIDVAVSLADADNKLDAAVKAENTRATGEESRIETKLDTEITRATTAEGNLADDIQAVADNLAQELLDRAAADTNLQGQIDFIVSNTDAAALDSLTEIVAAFQSADNSLEATVLANQTAINNEVARATAAEEANAAAILAEKTRAEGAESDLQANIDTKLALAGGTMSGNIAMGSNKVTGLASGTDATDAVNKGQLDAGLAAQHISVFDTDDLAEGSNLYYTDARSRAAVSVVDVEGNGDFSYNATTGVISADLSKSMLELTDVVDTDYTGKQEYVLRVNSTEDGMELVHASELQIFGQTYRQVIDGDGNQTTFALNFLADEASTLVFVGGVIQDPTSHYTVSDADQTITFTAALPLGTQAVIVARELVGASPFIADGSIQADKLDSTVAVGTRSGNTAVSTTGTVVDSFDASTYRSAKYLIQVDGGDGEFETREALVVHNGTVAYITEFAMVYTGDSLLGDASVQMNGTNVELVYTANAAGASVKVISTYIDA